MRNEWRLLLAACRVALETEGSSELASLAGAVADWDYVLTNAAQHGISPLVCRPLGATPGIPRHVRERMEAYFDQNAVRAISLSQHLIDITARLEEKGIPALPIKGPILAYTAYGDLARRQCGDLDVVIHRRDIPRARDALLESGFEPFIRLQPGPEAALIGADYHIPFINPIADVSLELHWALVRSGLAGLRSDEWPWRHSRRITLLGRPVHALTIEATLVYLCVHGCKHQWQKLGWVCDVAAISHTAVNLDWGAARALAADAGASHMFALGLRLAADLIGATSPLSHAETRTPVIGRLASAVQESIFCDGAEGSTPSPLAFQWRVRSRLSDRLAYCAMLVASPHPADVRVAALPIRARALYYVLRPARLFAKYSSKAFQRGRAGRLLRAAHNGRPPPRPPRGVGRGT